LCGIFPFPFINLSCYSRLEIIHQFPAVRFHLKYQEAAAQGAAKSARVNAADVNKIKLRRARVLRFSNTAMADGLRGGFVPETTRAPSLKPRANPQGNIPETTC